MKLEHPFIQLPLRFDAAHLAREVEALPVEAWRPHPQGYAGNDALSLVGVDGDPRDDAARGPMRPTPWLLACPYLMQVLQAIGAVWGRSRLMRLSGQAEVRPHVDINYYWSEHMRVHVPIVTQPTVRFECGAEAIHMAAGECWIFDTWRRHRVVNDDHRARIHLVADTVGGLGFWQHMRDARPHGATGGGWRPREIAPSPSPSPLDLETFNVPRVMSPWEVREHFAFLVGEGPGDEAFRAFERDVAEPFVRDWRALWAMHGDSGRGLPAYRALRERLAGVLPRYSALMLRNDVPLVTAVAAIIGANLLADADAEGPAAG